MRLSLNNKIYTKLLNLFQLSRIYNLLYPPVKAEAAAACWAAMAIRACWVAAVELVIEAIEAAEAIEAMDVAVDTATWPPTAAGLAMPVAVMKNI